MTWPRVPLGEIFTIARGGSPRPIDAFITDDPDGVNWIMIGDASEGSKYISSTKKRIRKEGVSRSRAVKSGDFLLTNSMSFGHPYILDTSGCIHDGWLVLSPQDGKVNRDFFYYMLGSPFVYAEFERLAAGAVVKNLNSELVRGVRVPLPPLAEQRRIADILDKADAIRRKRKEAIALTEELLRSAFLEMFGDPVTNPKGWPTRSVGELCELIVDCVNRTAPITSQATPYKMIRTTNVKAGKVLLDDVQFVERETFDTWNRRCVPRRNDVLLTREAPVGEAGLLRSDDKVFLGQRLMLYRTNSALLLPEYLVQSFLGPHLQAQFDTHGSGSTVKHLPLRVCRAFAVRLPPIALQQRYAAFARGVHETTCDTNVALDSAEELFKSLVARAFSGGLSA
ncbi:MAG: restriction endonuclease subunit S [Myxococcota bacterium]